MGSFDLKIFSYVKEWTLTRHFNNYQPLEKDFNRISYLFMFRGGGGAIPINCTLKLIKQEDCRNQHGVQRSIKALGSVKWVR